MNNQKGSIVTFFLIINLVLVLIIQLTTLAVKRIEKDKIKLEQNIFIKKYSNELRFYVKRINNLNRIIKNLTISKNFLILVPKIKLAMIKLIKTLKAIQLGIFMKHRIFLARHATKFLQFKATPIQIYRQNLGSFMRNRYNQTILMRRNFNLKSFSPVMTEIKFHLINNEAQDFKFISKRYDLI